MRPWSPMRRVQRVEQPKQLIGDQLRGATTKRQRIQTNRALGIGRIEQHHIADTLRWDALQHVGDQVALRLDHHHRPASLHVLGYEVQEQRGLADAGRPEQVQCRSESVGVSARGRSRPGNDAVPMTRPLRGIAADGAIRRLPIIDTGSSPVSPIGHDETVASSMAFSRSGRRQPAVAIDHALDVRHCAPKTGRRELRRS